MSDKPMALQMPMTEEPFFNLHSIISGNEVTMKQSYFKYLLALLLFGSNGIFAMQISLNSYEIVLLRTLIGSLLLIVTFLLTKGKITFCQHHKRQFVFLVISGIAMGTSWMFLYEAYQQIGVNIASLAYYCGPVIVMALSPFLFREKLTWLKVIGFLTVLCGIFLVNNMRLFRTSVSYIFLCFAVA